MRPVFRSYVSNFSAAITYDRDDKKVILRMTFDLRYLYVFIIPNDLIIVLSIFFKVIVILFLIDLFSDIKIILSI